MEDNRIVVMSRGRLPNMREQIASLLLFFRITKVEDKWNVKLEKNQIIWPTIFPR